MMKGFIKKLSVIGLLFISFHSLSQQPPLSVGWELWYPYQYHNSKQELTGLDLDIFNAIIKQTELSVTYTELPWKRHLNYLKTGDMDLAMGASYSQERAEYADYSIPYRNETVKLYVKNGKANSIILNNLTDLIGSPYMIGVEGGYYYGKAYQELIKQNKFRTQINEVIDIEQNVQLLLKGHIDGFLVDPVTMKAFVNKYKLQGEFEQHSITIYSDDIYIMVSKKIKDKTVLPKINKAIAHLIQNGKLDDIIKNWTKLQSNTN
ncbi:transporter substrate-binding domain-containing protein [Colwellia sp. 1_MG-2023]|uniref:substrate-binding periplasmic protein n=1 Tax=Colwellia sp. 1_MG-2023 TaxID=3062649 RepID=UPI0026E1B2C8|nr:transporter substrate-binding domain-containing protein [Colwellia sp. 1_MG-2023]MDO6446944.1 transporter substrate-binding domain-containing protein [Colwellia sp. 1_MG-2023]